MLDRLNDAMTRREVIALGATVLLAGVVDALLFSGYFASDDRSYSLAAHMIANHQPIKHDDIGALRLAINVPNAVVYWLAGQSVAAMAWMHIGYHLGLVVLAYVIGRIAHGRAVGHIAAAITATCPLLTVFAGAILPDIATAFWLAIALLLLLIARRRSADRRLPWPEALRFYGGVGFVLGVAYSCKETALVMTLPVAVEIMASAPRLRDPIWVRNGALAVFGLAAFVALEMLALRAVSGEWIFRPTDVSSTEAIFLVKAEGQGGLLPFDRIQFAVSQRLLPWLPYTAWLLFLPALLYPSRRRRSLCLALFFWWPFLYLTFGTMSLRHYVPPSIQTRYYGIVVLPAACMAGWLAVLGYRAAIDLLRRLRWRTEVWRRALPLAAAACFLLVFRAELMLQLPRAGNIYRATDARGFVLALATARTRYPGYPIVLSTLHRYRMLPLLLEDGAPDVYAGHLISPDSRAPSPPFLYLHALDEIDEVSAVADLVGLDLAELDVTPVDIVYPPVNRLEAIRHALGQAVSVTRIRTPRRASRGAAVLQLVTRKGDSAAMPAIPPVPTPMFIMQADAPATVDEARSGHTIEWWEPTRFSAQFFDGYAIRRAPIYPASQLPDRPRRLDVSLDLRLVRGRNPLIRVYLYGFSSSGALVGKSEVGLEVNPATRSVHVALDAPEPLAAFKVRFRIRTGSPGSLAIGDPIVGGR